MFRLISTWIPRSCISGSTNHSTLYFPLIQPSCNVTLLTSFKYADNNENAKKVTKVDRPYCIKLPKNNKQAGFGDIVTVAHRGKMYKALIVSNRKPSKTLPRYDHEYIVLLNDKLEPLGTRVTIPLPSQLRLRKDKFSKVLAITSKFI